MNIIRTLSFKQWLKGNEHKQPEKVLEWRKSMGATDEEIAEIEEEYDELERLFLDECEEQGYDGCFD